jgi:hypothetical protein
MIFDYKCDHCGKVEEYFDENSISVQPSMRVPEICPKCNVGKLVKLFTVNEHRNFDIIGYCYENVYGKKAINRNMTTAEQASVLLGEKDPW